MTVNRIAIEEHFWTPELRALRRGHDVLSDPDLGRRLMDLGDLRIAEMNEAGIDLQVISHVEPATQNFEPDEAVRLAGSANDLLHQAIQAHPSRFAGFAALAGGGDPRSCGRGSGVFGATRPALPGVAQRMFSPKAPKADEARNVLRDVAIKPSVIETGLQQHSAKFCSRNDSNSKTRSEPGRCRTPRISPR